MQLTHCCGRGSRFDLSSQQKFQQNMKILAAAPPFGRGHDVVANSLFSSAAAGFGQNVLEIKALCQVSWNMKTLGKSTNPSS